MKIFIFSVTAMFIFFSLKSNAQAKAVFFEIGGPGLASINYDMRFTKSESGFGGRIGIGGYSLTISSSDNIRSSAIFFPVGINYIMGKDERNYFEIGAGITPVIISSSGDGRNSDNFSSTFGHLNFGYRLQPKNGGFFFRATINPIFGSGYFIPYYGGISFGYKF
jgi:hypothetical protein